MSLRALKFRVDATLVHRVLDERFGGIANFADEWSRSGADGQAAQRSVKTIYAWLKHGLPTTHDTLFSFFAALDIDPIAALDFDRSDLSKHFGRLRHAFMLGGMNAGGFKPLFDLYRPSAGWPDVSLSQTFYHRNWAIFDFDHSATSVTNTYVTVTARGTDSVPVGWPRAFHIAYRRHSNADGLWRPYGSIISRFGEAILAHENGNIQRMSLTSRSTHQLRFQTFFGPSPAEFRLTCLHPFVGQVEDSPNPDVSLRFVG